MWHIGSLSQFDFDTPLHRYSGNPGSFIPYHKDLDKGSLSELAFTVPF